MRSSVIYLINCPMLDINFNHTVNFSSRVNQMNWFREKTKYKIENCSYLRKEQGVNIGMPFENLELCNYAMLLNEDGKPYFYFIIDKIYKNDNNTFLSLKLDVFQTYLFDINFSAFDSLIERTHLRRYDDDGYPVIYNLMEDESLEVGEYIKSNLYTLYDYTNKGGYIITSSTPLSAQNGGSGGTGGTGNGGGVKNKTITSDGLYFLKCEEGFSPTPYNIGDGTNTIGYGTTEKYENDSYNSLAPLCTEEQATIVMYDNVKSNYALQIYNTLKSRGVDMDNLKNYEFDAFVSLAYNAGVYGCTSSQVFIDFCNGVDKSIIAEKWLTTKVSYEGHKRRRRIESEIFFDGTYEFKGITNLDSGSLITENDGRGYIPTELEEVSGTELQNKIITSARKLIGKPYVWGGNYPPLGSDNGTDCSGLVQWSFNDNGISISRTTYTQINEGVEVSPENIQIADLVFPHSGHVFLYSGEVDGKHMCVEAPQTGLNIRERSFEFGEGYRVRRLL